MNIEIEFKDKTKMSDEHKKVFDLAFERDHGMWYLVINSKYTDNSIRCKEYLLDEIRTINFPEN